MNNNQNNQVVGNILNPVKQVKAHEKTSHKYNFVSTSNILERLSQHGWNVRQEVAVKCRNKDNEGFQKHMVRLNNEAFQYGDYHIEVLLTNSHLGNSSVKLNIGIYRLVCSNGLVVGTSFYERRVRHMGFTYDKLDLALGELIKQAPQVCEIIAKMKGVQLNEGQILELAKKFADKRLEKVERVNWVDYPKMLNIYREADRHTDLFTVYNILQEKVMRGGVKYTTKQMVLDERTSQHYEVEKNHTTRAIKNITNEIKLNEYMFDTAAEYLDILQAA